MGGNVWGTQNPSYVQGFGGTVAGADVACPSGSETNVIQIATVVAPTPGQWRTLIVGVLGISLGATPPTAIVLAARIGAGADFDSYQVPVGALVANATLAMPVFLNGPISTTLWFPSAPTVNITVAPTAQAVTVRFVGSRAYCNIWRLGDQ